jgi:hypothetical protein
MDHAGTQQAVFHRDNGEFAFSLDYAATVELASMDPIHLSLAVAQMRSNRTSERIRAAAAVGPETMRSAVPGKQS